MSLDPTLAEPTPTGYILGTQEATPLDFWVAVSPGQVLRLDDVVQAHTQRPDGTGVVTFFGVVDHVRTLLEGAPFDTDTFLAQAGSLPVNVAYVAHIQVTRIEPEEYLPPSPGDPVFVAHGADLDRALHFDGMEAKVPAGRMRSGEPAFFNFAFINGERGAHVNISGAGVAKNAPNRANAVRFLEYLASDEAQHIFADANSEYPAVASVQPGPVVARYATFKVDPTPVEVYGRRQAEAQTLLDEAGWR